MHVRGFIAIALAGLLAATLPGCNQAQTVIRVQPQVMEKAALAGEWYYLQTVVDVPHTIDYSFVGDTSRLEKITWDIQEDVLVARRSYEWIANGEYPGEQGISGTGEVGVPSPSTPSNRISTSAATTTPSPVKSTTWSSRTIPIAPGTTGSSCAWIGPRT
ncbi:MAG: hypothetical protein R3A78_04720 [Polyangiales bacterium]